MRLNKSDCGWITSGIFNHEPKFSSFFFIIIILFPIVDCLGSFEILNEILAFIHRTTCSLCFFFPIEQCADENKKTKTREKVKKYNNQDC